MEEALTDDSKVVGFLARVAFTARMGIAFLRLRRRQSDRVVSIRRALRAAGLGSLTAAERRWTGDIEAMRRRLLDDDREVTVMDFGAGSADADLTETEMEEGRPKTLTVAEACRVSKPRRWALLLFHLVRNLRPRVCVELGTCIGVSAAYQAAAMRLNGEGRLITLEGARPLAELAADNLASLGLDHAHVVPGRFQDTLGGVLLEFASVDFVFIDGHHDEHATLQYFSQVAPHLAPGAAVVLDDIGWSPGMTRAWKAIAASPGVELAIDLGAMGLCIMADTATCERRRPGEEAERTPVYVSVVIPTRNRADRLKEAVGSALSQTRRDLEVIVVDDASEDQTHRVIAELRAADPRVRSITCPSAVGAPAARNLGIKAARGSVVAFLDDDCIWAPNKLEAQLALLRHDRGVVYCRHAIRHGDTWVVEGEPGAATEDPVSALLGTNYIGTYSLVVRKDLLEAVGGFDETLPRLQDWDLVLRLGRHTRFGFVPDTLVQGDQLPGGISLDRTALVPAASRIIESHAEHLTRRQVAALHFGLGKFLLVDGQTAAARHHFLRAVWLDPITPLHWAGLVAWLLGPVPARWLRAVRRHKRASRAPGRPAEADARHPPSRDPSEP